MAAPPTSPASPDALRFRLALRLARFAVWLSRRLLGRTGGVIGGRVLAKVDPLAERRVGAGHHILIVSGTNGKSTTTAVLTAGMTVLGPVATNADGSNTPAGLLWTLATAQTENVVLEVDEAWLPWAAATFGAEALVLLNLSRDQLHRNPEVGRLANAWRTAATGVPIAIANADDPWVAWAGQAAARSVWVAAGQTWDEDSLVCPQCGELLDRSGPGWRCTSCEQRRPEPEWALAPGAIVAPGEVRLDYSTLPGQENLSNVAMALAAVTAFGGDPAAALQAMTSVSAVEGRYATVHIAGRDVRLVLAKNPASWRTALRLVGERAGRQVVLAFNADGVDGLDPSWLYDVDFDALRGHRIAVTGERATDMTVRLAMSGIEVAGQFGDLRSALTVLEPGPVDLIATYSAFLRARKELTRD
jgi:UDP-N-acetylmuramyl tripeptide synthase